MTIPIQRLAKRATLLRMGLAHRLETVSRDKRWPVHDIEMKRVELAECEALEATVHLIAAHEDVVREAIRKARGQ